MLAMPSNTLCWLYSDSFWRCIDGLGVLFAQQCRIPIQCSQSYSISVGWLPLPTPSLKTKKSQGSRSLPRGVSYSKGIAGLAAEYVRKGPNRRHDSRKRSWWCSWGRRRGRSSSRACLQETGQPRSRVVWAQSPGANNSTRDVAKNSSKHLGFSPHGRYAPFFAL